MTHIARKVRVARWVPSVTNEDLVSDRGHACYSLCRMDRILPLGIGADLPREDDRAILANGNTDVVRIDARCPVELLEDCCPQLVTRPVGLLRCVCHVPTF